MRSTSIHFQRTRGSSARMLSEKLSIGGLVLLAILLGPGVTARADEEGSCVGLELSSDKEMLEGWLYRPLLWCLKSNGSRFRISPTAADWSSSDESVATVDPPGHVLAISEGTATITASRDCWEAQTTVTIGRAEFPPKVETIEPSLATSPAGALFEMPVVVLTYLPTIDGVHLDAETTGMTATLAEAEERIVTFNRRVKFMLEEGSRFRGYKHAKARPSLGYRIVHWVTVYEPMPPGIPVPGDDERLYFPDYDQILRRFDSERFVDDLGVREFWIWGYHHGQIVPVESNMSSPTTRDVSNSHRFNDLPVHDHTYTVYNYNFHRSQSEAVHNHGHQLESILAFADLLQHGNSDFFWKHWTGRDELDNAITGRCGNTHMPPNTTQDYDYLNTGWEWSDIEDWRPEGGEQKLVNVNTWGDIPYAWPEGDVDFPGRVESQYYIYWMQAMPGHRNGIEYLDQKMTNWWLFTADWDAAIQSELGLYGSELPAVLPKPPKCGVVGGIGPSLSCD